MNYLKLYQALINKTINRGLQGYSEKHHIIPRCLGGKNNKENLAILTAKEHYVAHLLLTKIYPENQKIIYAFWMMRNRIKINISSGKIYEDAKKIIVQNMRKNVGTKDAITKMSIAKKGKSSWNGKKHSDESKLKQSESAKTRRTTTLNEQKRREGISKGLSKIVLQYDLEGNFIKEFPSITIAAKEINSQVGSIVHAIQGKRVKKHKNFIWRYK